MLALRRTDALIIPGTGLLTDSYGLFTWGPYDLFRWCVAAKLCRCKLIFVSVGAGPIYTRAGRFFVKAVLKMADFRSYRDESSRQYLQSIGFPAHSDPVYPDLVFSLDKDRIPSGNVSERQRKVVGLGLMEYAGKYSTATPDGIVYSAYLETLTGFGKWLLAHDYGVQLLIGDLVDRRVVQEFRSLLRERSSAQEATRIIDVPITSVEDLLSQLAATDFVVATRFHNVLLSLLLGKPAIAISFHPKCSSLMSQMGLSEYCQDINGLQTQKLIEQFCTLQKNAERLRLTINEKVADCRASLDEQYRAIATFLDLG